MTTTVVLVDDHPIVREGLKTLLESQQSIKVIGEAANGEDAIAIVLDKKPDVLIVDLMIPRLNGLEVTRQIAERQPTTKIVVLSMHVNEAYVLEALHNGASGYVIKDVDVEHLLVAIREVMADRRYLSPPLSDHAIASYLRKASLEPVDALETLTNRERQTLYLTAEGYTSQQIGEQLGVSSRTVEAHRAGVMKKLHLKSHLELIKFCIKRGIVTLE